MFFFFFFFDNEKKLQDKQIELHYLSKTISYGIEKNDGNEFFDSYGVLEKQNSKDESDNEFKESDYFWLISHRKEIQSMSYPSENEIIEYIDDFDEDELSLPLRKFQNVFGLLSSVLRNPKVKSVSGGIYDTFEEAVKYFYEENLETYLSATREQIEFRELLYFCFIGRTPTN